ncbi:MAG: DUF5058 family protein [Tissierellia bacterium]|nr:DUF5058 family protein [Tissierellia bacterium]
MNTGYYNIVNSPLIWFACFPPVFIVMFECIKFYRQSRKQAEILRIDPELIKASIKSSVVSAIGPSVVVMATVLALITYVGTPLAWMRNSIIGNAQEELLAANFAADGMGLALNDALANGTLSLEYFSTAAFVMAAGMCGYVITSALFSDKVALIGEKFSGGNAELLPILTLGAVVGGMSNIVVGQSIPVSMNTLAAVIGAATMAVMKIIANKKSEAIWIKEWSMTISMFAGMVIAYFASIA